MLRGISLAIVAAALCGCGGILQAEQVSLPGSSAGCAAVAKQRADDAALAGYNSELQRRVSDYTFKECVRGREQQQRP